MKYNINIAHAHSAYLQWKNTHNKQNWPAEDYIVEDVTYILLRIVYIHIVRYARTSVAENAAKLKIFIRLLKESIAG